MRHHPTARQAGARAASGRAAKAVQSGCPLPRFYLACGNEDYAVALSDAYHDYLLSIGLSHAYYKAAGIHGYPFAEQALIWSLQQWQLQRSQQA